MLDQNCANTHRLDLNGKMIAMCRAPILDIFTVIQIKYLAAAAASGIRQRESDRPLATFTQHKQLSETTVQSSSINTMTTDVRDDS